jgi:hypothetical protein
MAEIELLDEDAIGDLLGIAGPRVHALVRDGVLLEVRIDGKRGIPASFVQDGAIVKHLTSVITQLHDARYGDVEIVEWLHREDDSLPGSPIQALRENRGTEVKRRAQVAGF